MTCPNCKIDNKRETWRRGNSRYYLSGLKRMDLYYCPNCGKRMDKTVKVKQEESE